MILAAAHTSTAGIRGGRGREARHPHRYAGPAALSAVANDSHGRGSILACRDGIGSGLPSTVQQVRPSRDGSREAPMFPYCFHRPLAADETSGAAQQILRITSIFVSGRSRARTGDLLLVSLVAHDFVERHCERLAAPDVNPSGSAERCGRLDSIIACSLLVPRIPPAGADRCPRPCEATASTGRNGGVARVSDGMGIIVRAVIC
jgi:hypothetical protein